MKDGLFHQVHQAIVVIQQVKQYHCQVGDFVFYFIDSGKSLLQG
jgi:hypothetical protein